MGYKKGVPSLVVRKIQTETTAQYYIPIRMAEQEIPSAAGEGEQVGSIYLSNSGMIFLENYTEVTTKAGYFMFQQFYSLDVSCRNKGIYSPGNG
jgi:hypothetical protein